MASLYIGNLNPDCTEASIYRHFAPIGKLLSIRLGKDKKTGRCVGYGFINYASETDAQIALSILNYTSINGNTIRLMQAGDIRKLPSEANVFIKNLHSRIDEKALHDIFSNYGNILSLKLVAADPGVETGTNYAFIQYQDEQSAEKAIASVNEKMIFGRVVYVDKFAPKVNRTVFIKNFDIRVDDSHLREMCKDFGDVVSAKVMKDLDGISKCFGFVTFKDEHGAKAAVFELNGKVVNGRRMYASRAMTKNERQKDC